MLSKLQDNFVIQLGAEDEEEYVSSTGKPFKIHRLCVTTLQGGHWTVDNDLRI